MGWADCGTDANGRPIGYAYEAECDEPGCAEAIDRGLSFVCGGMHGGDTHGCGEYFCGKHLGHAWSEAAENTDEEYSPQLCARCQADWLDPEN